MNMRRNYIYEDAFDKLSPDNEANLRLKMRVQLVNAAGECGNHWECENMLSTKMVQAWTRQALTVVVSSESFSVSCSKLLSTPTEAFSPSPGTRCSIQGIILNSRLTAQLQTQKE